MSNKTITSKYYTPSIEEFHVGFEYQCLSVDGQVNDEEDWNTFHFGTDDDMYEFAINDWSESLGYYLQQNKVRVKQLDQEDIESFGFTVESDYGAGTTYQLYNSFSLQTHKSAGITYGEHQVRIFQLGLFGAPDKMFIGDIKNKSELKKVLEMLGILK